MKIKIKNNELTGQNYPKKNAVQFCKDCYTDRSGDNIYCKTCAQKMFKKLDMFLPKKKTKTKNKKI